MFSDVKLCITGGIRLCPQTELSDYFVILVIILEKILEKNRKS